MSAVEASETPENVNEELVASLQQEDGAGDVANAFVDIEINLPTGGVILIANVITNESLNSVKQSLAEYQETVFYTSYRLQFRHAIDAEGHTISLPENYNQYVELAVYLSPAVRKCVLDLVVESYDVKKVKAQVKRTRETVAFPPQINSSVRSGRTETEKAPATSDKQSAAKEREALVHNLPKSEALFAEAQLSDFYRETLLRTGTAVEGPSKKLSDAIKGITTSGWNPPPAHRKLQGDLMYLEVVTANEGTLHITVNSRGFYLNKSNRNHFDPSPAANPHHHHELFQTLLAASATLRTAWASVTADSSKAPAKEVGALDLIASVYAQGRGDLASVKAQWNVMPASTFGADAKTPHTYDLYRAQEDASSMFGVEELGAPREWNDEIQSLRSLPAKDLSEKTMKVKLEYKIISEFTEACKTAVVAISEGAITPITDSDPAQSDIYVYNGIFYSKAEDTKDSFKICNGDEAFRKCTGKDLQNQKLIQSLGVEGVNTVLCTIVDYKGQRYIGQSIIPGIFSQGENSASLVHGMLDKNKPITVKNSGHKLLEQIGKACFIPARTINRKPFSHLADAAEPASAADRDQMDSLNKLLGTLELEQASPIKVDDSDSIAAAEAETTPHIGPIEGKLLRGSDGRVYALEMMRLTPRDANYVHSDKSTGKISAEELAQTDKDMSVSYVLRKELINIFAQRKLGTLRQALMVEATAAEEKFKAAVAARRPAPVEGEEKKEEPVLTAEEEAEQQKLATEFAARYAAINLESLKLEINPNVFVNFDVDTDAEVVAKDEALVREMSAFLWDTILPIVTKNVREGDLQAKDSEALVTLIHRMGVNVRYLGQLARLAKKEEEEDRQFLKEGKQRVHSMPVYWLELAVVELLARAVKHTLNSYYKGSKEVAVSPAKTIAALLNHLFAAIYDKKNAAPEEEEGKEETKTGGKGKKGKGKKQTAAAAPAAASVAAAASAESVSAAADEFGAPNAAADRAAALALISSHVLKRFNFKLSLDATSAEGADIDLAFLHSRIGAATLLRRICKVSGIRIATRAFDFAGAAPFNVSDIVGLSPITKTCEPEVLLPEFHEMLTSSVNMLQQGNFSLAYELSHQAYNVINQITGPCHIHSHSANDQITDVLINVGDFEPALQMSSKSLAVAVQLEGLDSAEVMTQHAQLSVLHAELRNGPAAIQHLLSAKYILTLIGGPRHTELAGIYGRLATLYEEAKMFDQAFACLLRARGLVSDLLKSCFYTTALAEFSFRRGHFPDAVSLQKQSYAILKELLPEADERLGEAKALLETYIRKCTADQLEAAKALQNGTQQVVIEHEPASEGGAKKKNKKSKAKK